MKYLYDKQGNPVAFILASQATTVHSNNGEHLAEIDEGFVYDTERRHIGWFVNEQLYDRKGEIVLSNRDMRSAGASRPARRDAPRFRNRYAGETAHEAPSFFGSTWSSVNGLNFFKAARREMTRRSYAHSTFPPQEGLLG